MMQSTRLVVCTFVQTKAASFSMDVNFYYRMETTTLDFNMTEAMSEFVSGAAIDTVVSALCSGAEEIGNRGGHLLASASDCVLSISFGTPAIRVISCDPENKEVSQSCSWYRGTLRMMHTGACSTGDVSAAAFAALTKVEDSTDFLAYVNKNISSSSTRVTSVVFTESPTNKTYVSGAATKQSRRTSRSQLTAGGVITVLITGTVVMVAVLLIVNRRRRTNKRRKLNLCNKLKHMDGTERTKNPENEDTIKTSRSAGPDWAGDFGAGQALAPKHCCSSALCKVCRLDGAKLLQVDENGTHNHLQGLRSFSQDEVVSMPRRIATTTDLENGNGSIIRIHGLVSKDFRDDVEGMIDSLFRKPIQSVQEELSSSTASIVVGSADDTMQPPSLA